MRRVRYMQHAQHTEQVTHCDCTRMKAVCYCAELLDLNRGSEAQESYCWYAACT